MSFRAGTFLLQMDRLSKLVSALMSWRDVRSREARSARLPRPNPSVSSGVPLRRNRGGAARLLAWVAGTPTSLPRVP